MSHSLHGTPTFIHEGERFQKMPTIELREQAAPTLFLTESGFEAFGEFVQHHKSDVVTCVAVGFSRVAESDDEQGREV